MELFSCTLNASRYAREDWVVLSSHFFTFWRSYNDDSVGVHFYSAIGGDWTQGYDYVSTCHGCGPTRFSLCYNSFVVSLRQYEYNGLGAGRGAGSEHGFHVFPGAVLSVFEPHPTVTGEYQLIRTLAKPVGKPERYQMVCDLCVLHVVCVCVADRNLRSFAQGVAGIAISGYTVAAHSGTDVLLWTPLDVNDLAAPWQVSGTLSMPSSGLRSMGDLLVAGGGALQHAIALHRVIDDIDARPFVMCVAPYMAPSSRRT